MRVGRKRQMEVAGIYGVSRRKWITTTTRDHTMRPAPDLVERNFSAPTPNELWGGRQHLHSHLDGLSISGRGARLFSRRVVEWAMETHLRTELVLAALNMCARTASACGRDSSLRPGNSIHFARIRDALPAGRGAALDGFGRRLFRQQQNSRKCSNPEQGISMTMDGSSNFVTEEKAEHVPGLFVGFSDDLPC
jgi:hypothetical protein